MANAVRCFVRRPIVHARTEQITGAVQHVAAGTNNQVSLVQETHEAMAQLRQTIDQIAESSQDQARRAEHSTAALDE